MSNVIIQIWRIIVIIRIIIRIIIKYDVYIVIMTSQTRDMKFLMMDSGSLGMVSYLSVIHL